MFRSGVLLPFLKRWKMSEPHGLSKTSCACFYRYLLFQQRSRDYCKPPGDLLESPLDVKKKDENTAPPATCTKESIQDIINGSDVVIFMKGTPNQPQCGFSKRAVSILSLYPIENMIAVDVFEEPSLRTMIKEFTYDLAPISYRGWPTIPQIFIKGEFIGGCDILSEMYSSGSLTALLKQKKLIQ